MANMSGTATPQNVWPVSRREIYLKRHTIMLTLFQFLISYTQTKCALCVGVQI